MSRIDIPLFLQTKELAQWFHKYHWNTITISAAYSEDDIMKILADIQLTLRTGAGSLKKDYGGIKGGYTEAVGVALYRNDPAQLSLWIYREFLGTILYYKNRQEAPMNLLPVRRFLMLVCDMHKYCGSALSLFNCSQISNSKHSKTDIVFLTLIDFIDFCNYLKIPKGHCLRYGLSILFEGLFNQGSLPEYFHYGLGNQPYILSNIRLASQSDKHTSLMETFTAINYFYGGLKKGKESPQALLYKLSNGKAKGVSPLTGEIYSRYKGVFPVGTALVKGKKIFVVIDHRNEDQHKVNPIAVQLGRSSRSTGIVQLPSDLKEYKKCSLNATQVNMYVYLK
jgi:hypothetical protein